MGNSSTGFSVKTVGTTNCQVRNGTTELTVPQACETQDWRHIAAVFNSQNLLVYSNGEEIARMPASALAIPEDAFALFGSILNTGWFAGSMDEIRLENTVRSPGWLKLAYLTQSPSRKIIQIAPVGPENLAVTLADAGSALLQFNAPAGSVDSVEIQRRTIGLTEWATMASLLATASQFIDPAIGCGLVYEYRTRFLYGSAYSEWSAPVTVAGPRCYFTSSAITLICMALDQYGAPVSKSDAAAEVRLFESMTGAEPVFTESFTTRIDGGYCIVRLNLETDISDLIRTKGILYAEFTVEGTVQTPRIPVSAQGAGSLTNPSMLAGSGSPVGVTQARVGALYTDISTGTLWFKYGLSTYEWKAVE